MSARQALELATLGGARVLGRDDIGALAPGMSADVVAFPVDFRTAGPDDWDGHGQVSDGLRLTDLAVREWIGLAAARFLGQTDALLPAP